MSVVDWTTPSIVLGILAAVVAFGTLILRFVIKAEKAMTETAVQTKIANGHLADVSSRVTTLERAAVDNAMAQATKANTNALEKILHAIEEVKQVLHQSRESREPS